MRSTDTTHIEGQSPLQLFGNMHEIQAAYLLHMCRVWVYPKVAMGLCFSLSKPSNIQVLLTLLVFLWSYYTLQSLQSFPTFSNRVPELYSVFGSGSLHPSESGAELSLSEESHARLLFVSTP